MQKSADSKKRKIKKWTGWYAPYEMRNDLHWGQRDKQSHSLAMQRLNPNAWRRLFSFLFHFITIFFWFALCSDIGRLAVYTLCFFCRCHVLFVSLIVFVWLSNSSYLDFTCYETWYGIQIIQHWYDATGDRHSKFIRVKCMSRTRIKHWIGSDSEWNEK